MKVVPLTLERLKSLVRYEPDTGRFVVIGKMRGKRRGQLAGHINSDGYRKIGIDGKTYPAAKLAWLWMTGGFPSVSVDHRDRNRGNDRWGNLRLADRCENMANRCWGQASGHKGVYRASRRRWMSIITWRGERHYLGSFESKEAAAAAYQTKAQQLHGEFAAINPKESNYARG